MLSIDSNEGNPGKGICAGELLSKVESLHMFLEGRAGNSGWRR